MGLYDTITWHGDLPGFPEGLKPWVITFQSKSLPDCCQRMFEVTKDGQFQLREFIGEGLRYTDDPATVAKRVLDQHQERTRLRKTGETLNAADYSTQVYDYTGELIFYGGYGDPPNGWLKFRAIFKSGVLQSVRLKKHRMPDLAAWDAHLEQKRSRTGGMSHFIIKQTKDTSTESDHD